MPALSRPPNPTTWRAAERRWACIAAGCIAGALGLATLSPAPVGVFWDDALYVILGKALATGEGYRYIQLPGQPAATLYPPLWPALLSLVWRASPDFPDNVPLMKLLNPALLALGAAGSTLLAIRVTRVRPWIAALTVVACLAIAPTLLVSAVLMSEPLGTALAGFALATATRAVVRGRLRDGMIAGGLVGLAILARSASVALVPALASGLLWRRSRIASGTALLVAAALAAPWFVWSTAHAHDLPPAIRGSYGPYVTWLLAAYASDPDLVLHVVWKNLSTVVRELGIVTFGGLPDPVRPAALMALGLLTIAGTAVAGRRVVPLAVMLLAYSALVLVWPYAPGRFVWAALPFYAVLSLAAISGLHRRRRTLTWARHAGAVGAVMAAVALAMLTSYDVRGFRSKWHASATDRMAASIAPPLVWIAHRTSLADTIASDVHLPAYLYAGRVGVPISTLTVPEYVRPKSMKAMRAELAAIDATYRPRWWIASGAAAPKAALRDWAASEPELFEVVAELPGGGLALRSASVSMR